MRHNIIKLIESGIPALQVAKKTGIPQNTVYRIFGGTLDNITLKNAELLNNFYKEMIFMDNQAKAKELHDAFETILRVHSDSKPQIFIHDGSVQFSPNSVVGGMAEVLYNDADNCKIVFDIDDWREAIWGAEEFEYEQSRVQAILNAIECADLDV